MKLLLFFFTLFALSHGCHGQKFYRLYVHGDVSTYSADVPAYESIRAVISNYPSQFDNPLNNELEGRYSQFAIGAKAEFKISANEKWLAATGVNYVTSRSAISHRYLYSLLPSFFFFKLREDGTTTDYVTISEIRQYSSFVGIPLEISFRPFPKKRFNLVIKAGGSMHVNVSNRGEVDFYNPAMEKHERQVLDQFNRPDRLTGTFYIGPGGDIAVGKLRLGLEFRLPAAFINTDGAGLLSPNAGAGMSLYISFLQTELKNEK